MRHRLTHDGARDGIFRAEVALARQARPGCEFTAPDPRGEACGQIVGQVACLPPGVSLVQSDSPFSVPFAHRAKTGQTSLSQPDACISSVCVQNTPEAR